jgi:hypothetical protein
MALDQDLIDAFNETQQALIDNADWWPNNLVKLKAYIDAYTRALAIMPQLASHGGSAAEELRFDKNVQKSELDDLRKRYTRLASRKNGNGGFRQNQLSRNSNRW